MGKTRLLAHFIDTYSLTSGETLHYRFIGGSDGSLSTERLIRSLLEELKAVEKIKSDIPANSIDMMNKLPDFLEEAGKIGKTVIVIDALNQLESGMDDLYFIPSALPQNVKLIASFKRGEKSADEYYKLHEKSDDMILQTVKPFDSEDDRKALVVAYLETYFKELDEPRVNSLINSDGAENPLFLKAALSELRVFGVHNDLTEVIKSRFGNTPVTAFNAILSRMESDAAYTKLTPAVMLPHLFGWIAHSRYGLSVDELADLSLCEKLTDNKADAFDAIYLILRQLRPFLAKRDGRVDFFYESFKIAATERYTGNHKYARKSRDWHKSLAQYFETLPLTNRHKLMEQAWQYANAGMDEKYKGLLYDYCFIDARLKEFGVSDLISDYAYSEERSVKLLRDFHTLSEHILAFDPSQLASQLWGRMADFEDDDVRRLLKQAVDVKKERREVWLRPKKACMPKPGSGVVRVLQTILPKSVRRSKIVMVTPVGQSFVFTQDAQSIVYTDRVTNRLTIMNIETGKNIKTFGVSAYRLAISKNGNQVAFVTPDNKLGICDISTGEIKFFDECIIFPQLHDLIISGNIIVTLTCSNNGHIDSRNKNVPDAIQIWDIDTYKCNATIKGFHGLGSRKDSIKLTADGSKLITTFTHFPMRVAYKTISIWDTATGECLRIYEGEYSYITKISFEAKTVFVDEKSDTIYTFSTERLIAQQLSTGKKLYSQAVDYSAGYAISPDGRYLVCGYKKINIIDTKTGVTMYSIPSENQIFYYSFSPDGQTIITLGEDYGIWLWDFHTRECIGGFLRYTGKVINAFITPDRRYLVNSSHDGMIKIWDMTYVNTTANKATNTNSCLAVIKDNQFITGNILHNEITAYNAVTTKKLYSYNIKEQSPEFNRFGMNIDFDQVSNRILISRRYKTLIYTSDTKELVSVIGITENILRFPSTYYELEKSKLLDNGRKIITVNNNRAFILDTETGGLLYSFPVGITEQFMYYLNHYIERDGKYPETLDVKKWLLIGDQKRIITYGTDASETRIWDIFTQKEIIRFDKIAGSFQALGVLPDESAFIVCSNGELSKWNMATGFEMDKPKIEDNPIISGELRSVHEFLFFRHSDYVLISTAGKTPLLVLINYKTGRIVTYIQNELQFEKCVCTPDGEHIACLNSGELSFLKLENMEWDDDVVIPEESPEPIPQKAPEPQKPEPPQTTPKEKPKGFFARLFGKK
jgi:WD40 repeat protein